MVHGILAGTKLNDSTLRNSQTPVFNLGKIFSTEFLIASLVSILKQCFALSDLMFLLYFKKKFS
jgi:hypothetical protein